MRSLEENLRTTQRILDAFFEYQAKGGKDNIHKFKRKCEEGVIDLHKYKPTSKKSNRTEKSSV